MSLADELAKLEELRRSGALTDAEFAQAKAKLLNADVPANDAVAAKFGEQLAEMRYQNELERIDREWAIERERHMLMGRYGRRYLPTVGIGWGTAIIGGIFGAFWIIMTISILSGAPDTGGFGGAKVLFPLSGIVITIGAVAYGVYIVRRAEAYNRAYAAYRNRRAAVTKDQLS